MKKFAVTAAACAAAMLAVAGCGGSSSGSAAKAGGSPGVQDKTPVTITAWSFFTGREQKLVQQQLDAFHAQNPWITVKFVGGQADDKTITAVRGGSGPDITLAQGSENVMAWCASGAWQDMKPMIKKDSLDVAQFPAATQAYTTYKNKQCGLPLLADAYGLYYNKDLLAAAGYTAPPKTWEELTSMAKKLTVRGTDGTIQRAGFVPLDNFYENRAPNFGVGFGVTWFDKAGKSSLSSDPAWTTMFTWQKDLVDWYGYQEVKRFSSGLGKEFSADNAFYTGKIAMMIDGEWRPAFIKDEKPDLNYGTAPVPNIDPGKYGAGRLSGTVLGIPKGSKHVEAAWMLAKWLATDPKPLTALALGINNVPTTKEVLGSPEVRKDPHFATFVDIAANAHSQAVPGTLSGRGPMDKVDSFMEKWQAGNVPDLAKGLSDLDRDVDNMLSQNSGAEQAP